LLELLLADLTEFVARVVRADLLILGQVVEDLFSGKKRGERTPSPSLSPGVRRDLDRIVVPLP
jgi:hypothetical protein